MNKLSVLMPAYNEQHTIERIIRLVEKVDLSKLDLTKEIIIVDDGSKDETLKIIRRLQREYDNIRLLVHSKNQGKGAAVRTALEAATGDVMIVQDADLEYDPNDYVYCLRPILEGKARVVYGSRRLNQENKQHSGLSYFWGGLAISWIFNLLYRQRLTDEPTCYKTFAADVVKGLTIEGNGFEWEPEVSAKIAKMGIKIIEVPISYFPRSRNEGKKIGWTDGIKAILTMIKYRFS